MVKEIMDENKKKEIQIEAPAPAKAAKEVTI
jgi:hypothetical protein